jgi:hypothetical protein
VSGGRAGRGKRRFPVGMRRVAAELAQAASNGEPAFLDGPALLRHIPAISWRA